VNEILTILVALLGSAVVSAFVAHWGERARAREERRQGRLGKTYLAVVEVVLRASDWVDRTLPLVSSPSDPTPPEFPTDTEQRLLMARLSTYGSPAMRAAFLAVSKAQRDFARAVGEREYRLNNPLAHRTAGETESEARALGEYRVVREERVRPAVAALLGLANAELAERHVGWWRRTRTWVDQHRPRRKPAPKAAPPPKGGPPAA
jgi:hypothetical protein